MAQKYDDRRCPVCNKQFTPDRPSRICCSLACQEIRTKQSKHDNYLSYKQKIEKLETENLYLLVKIDTLVDKLAQARQEFAKYKRQVEGKATQDGAKSEDSATAIKDEINKILETYPYCNRMKLKAKKLPCGFYDICFRPDKCDKAPDKKLNNPGNGSMNPGSSIARDNGCTCPVLDNEYGKGFVTVDGKPQFVINDDCPLHGSKGDNK